MKVTIDQKAKTMTIVLPVIDPPQPSKGKEGKPGKTLLVATSHGNKETELEINGLPVYVGVNAYTYKEKK